MHLYEKGNNDADGETGKLVSCVLWLWSFPQFPNSFLLLFIYANYPMITSSLVVCADGRCWSVEIELYLQCGRKYRENLPNQALIIWSRRDDESSKWRFRSWMRWSEWLYFCRPLFQSITCRVIVLQRKNGRVMFTWQFLLITKWDPN